jgi:hypothetical protein
VKKRRCIKHKWIITRSPGSTVTVKFCKYCKELHSLGISDEKDIPRILIGGPYAKMD